MQEQAEIEGAFISHFSKIFRSSNPTTKMIANNLGHVENRVTSKMNNELHKHFTGEEVKEALYQVAPLKSLGPYRYGACF